jgi:hypothetical protein
VIPRSILENSIRAGGVDAPAKGDALLESKGNLIFRQKALDGSDGIKVVWKFSVK